MNIMFPGNYLFIFDNINIVFENNNLVHDNGLCKTNKQNTQVKKEMFMIRPII